MPFLYLILAVAALLAPGLALAAPSTLNPIDGNSWDLIVFGNGRVIYDIMMGVKMLMVPDAGDSGFTLLLLLMATLGFLVLAVKAGFDPGKNLMKMFGYIFLVWMVTLFTTKIVVNVQVHDMVVNQAGQQDSWVVTGVPALVALPSALTSQVGQYFTKSLETYFSVPAEFKLTGGAAGQFNLFAKMVEESNEYGFSYPALKQSLSAYTADCVVPAMALLKLKGPGKDGELTGVDALLRTNDLMKTYKSAQHKSIMTTYFPIPDQGGAATPGGTLGGMGTVETCEKAYDNIEKDMNAHAAAMLGRGAEAWKKAGIMVPFETAFRSMLAQAAAPGSVASGFSSPSGYILQQGFLNSMTGSFRTAAAQTGNSELMQAASASQAEASQKSAWVASFSTFNNMMGYVFTVLQAFIFAITPLIIVALLVPGLGAGIFKNYAQILIWLTLWMPCFAIINFVITSFAAESFTGVLNVDGGLSMNSKGAFNEKTKNMVIAAQFLGTMVPMITWGIVKGAMAFTEFISSGVGSQFASQAGAAAASGNLSMNNMSMDNYSANKFNTAMSSAVGFQATNAFANAGALDVVQAAGGSSASMHGATVDAKQQLSESIGQKLAEQRSVSHNLSSMKENTASTVDAMSRYQKGDHSVMTADAYNQAMQMARQVTKSNSAGENTSASSSSTNSSSGQRGQGMGTTASTEFGVGMPGGISPIKAGASAGMNGNTKTEQQEAYNKADQAAHGTSTASSVSKQESGTASSGNTHTVTRSDAEVIGMMRSHDNQVAFRQAASEALQRSESVTAGLEHMQSLTSTASFSSGMTLDGVNQLMSQVEAARGMGSAAEIRERFNELSSRSAEHFNTTSAAVGGSGGAFGGSGGSAFGTGGGTGLDFGVGGGGAPAGGGGAGGGGGGAFGPGSSSAAGDMPNVAPTYNQFVNDTGAELDNRTQETNRTAQRTAEANQTGRDETKVSNTAVGALAQNAGRNMRMEKIDKGFLD